MPKVDLHSHSVASPDGGINAAQYEQLVDSGKFAAIAVTDHNRIDFAQKLNKTLGPTIIVGEEIMTTAGEIIGLFLKKLVQPGQTPQATIKAIRAQKGLVCIPHPFETLRHGLQIKDLDQIAQDVDLIEVHNGRAVFQNRSQQAKIWARRHHVVAVASSDAHGLKGVGSTYTRVKQPLNQDNFLKVLSAGTMTAKWPPLRSLFYPKLNRLRNRFRRLK
jgi:predicted metal-dependent phosphoesterase TrpH